MEPDNSTPPPSDASKKRLIEDTEDWHPRTGTSQSRSFRILAQLTGTDFSKSGPEPGILRVTDECLSLSGESVGGGVATDLMIIAAPR